MTLSFPPASDFLKFWPSFVQIRPLGGRKRFVLRPTFRNFDRSSVRIRPWGGRKGLVLCPSPSSLDDILSVLGPPPSLKRTYLKKSFRPASFIVRRPPPTQDGRPRPATPAAMMTFSCMRLWHVFFNFESLTWVWEYNNDTNEINFYLLQCMFCFQQRNID